VPADSRERVLDLDHETCRIGLGGWLPGRMPAEILNLDGHIGDVMMSGLNPVAIMKEWGISILHVGAVSEPMKFREIFHYDTLGRRAGAI